MAEAQPAPAETELQACARCGHPAVIAATRAQDDERRLVYQGRCCACDNTAPENTNYDRAVDFWHAWNASLLIEAATEAHEREDDLPPPGLMDTGIQTIGSVGVYRPESEIEKAAAPSEEKLDPSPEK